MSENNELIINDDQNKESNQNQNKVQKSSSSSSAKVEEKKKVQKKEEKKKVLPKIFFKEDSKVEISVDGYHSNETGELQFAIPSDNNDNKDSFENLFTKVTYKFWFSRCPYDKLNRYRTRSMIYNSEDQNNTINEMRLREFFLIFHLVDWDLKDEDGNKIELTFDPDKALSDESLKLIYTLPNNLLDVVLSTYEKKMSI